MGAALAHAQHAELAAVAPGPLPCGPEARSRRLQALAALRERARRPKALPPDAPAFAHGRASARRTGTLPASPPAPLPPLLRGVVDAALSAPPPPDAGDGFGTWVGPWMG